MQMRIGKSNTVMICGYVPRDAEVRKTQTGKTLTTWSVAVDKRKETPDGEEATVWANCQAWHDAARVAADIRKGDNVLCVGRIEKNESNGTVYTNLVCEFISIMHPPVAPAPAQTAPAQSDLSDFESLLDDGEAPF